jgi:putative ABC transport system permease protein
MRALDRKLWRDVWHYRGQLAAIVAVVSCGIALFVTLRSMNGFLRGSRDQFYNDYRFANIFAPLERAPMSVAISAATLPGVAATSGRITKEVTLDVPGLTEPAIGRLVSITVPREASLNDVYLTAGRWPAAERPGEVIASTAFSAANALAVGDSIGAVINGRWQWLHIVGTGISPEYVYEVSSAGLFPDNRRFGVVWMSYGALADAFDMRGAFNDLTLRTARGVSERAVIDDVDRVLRPYGGVGAFGRSVQTSHQFLDGEIEETQVTSVLLPAIFLGVTAFLLHIVLSRLVGTQREQVATLKAFGYSNARVGAHYLTLALVPILVGSIVGAGLGLILAGQLAGVYGRFFQFPSANFVPDWTVVAIAVCVGASAGSLGALGAVARTVALVPAEAMRAESPTRFAPGVLERFRFFRALSPTVHIVARNVQRRPVKTLLSVIGIGLAVGIIVTTLALFDVVDVMKNLQFHAISREDVTVTFEGPRSSRAVPALARLPGVLAVEPFRAVPVRIRGSGRSYRTVILGLSGEGRLHRVMDRDGRERRAPTHGVLCSAILAEILGVRGGDSVVVDVLEGARPRLVVEVAGVVDDLFGALAFMDDDALRRMLGGGPVASGAYLKVDPRVADDLYSRLKRLPAVSGVSVRVAELRGFERTIAESFSISLYTAMGFACVIAFGVVYNGTRVALSERGRELASLRVLGFSRHEVTMMLLGEQALLLAAALPTGLLITYALCWLVSTRFDSELFRIPVVVSTGSYLVGAATVLFSGAVSALAVRGRIARLDLVAVLKTRE